MKGGSKKASSSHVGLDSGLCCHEKIHGTKTGADLSGQVGGNNTPTKPVKSISGHGKNFKMG